MRQPDEKKLVVNGRSMPYLLNPLPGDTFSTDLILSLRGVLTEAMQAIFFTAFIAALLALFATLLTPKGRITQLGAAKTSPDLELEKVNRPARRVSGTS